MIHCTCVTTVDVLIIISVVMEKTTVWMEVTKSTVVKWTASLHLPTLNESKHNIFTLNTFRPCVLCVGHRQTV